MLPKKTQEESILWIIGDGDERSYLVNQAKQLDIKNIKFWGQVQNKQLPDFYAATTVFVAPSVIDSNGDTEGQGVILLEAMASNTPIIATTVGGIPEVITNGETSLLIPPNNAGELSNSIQQVFNNKEQVSKLITNAQYKVESMYSWESISQQFISTFNNTINIKKENTHRDGFSTTVNRNKKAKKILTILAKSLVAPVKNKLILDIGTGSGDIASYIGKHNTVVSVDISDCRKNKKNFYFSRCNESLPFKLESFDVVISNHVIEHVQNQELHIKEIKRVLKKGGTLYLATPNRLWPFEVHYKLCFLHYLPHKLFLKVLKSARVYKEDINLLTLNDLETLLKKSSLISFSGKIIKSPSAYLMNTPPWLEKILNIIPIQILELTTFLHPTFIFIYRNIR